MSTTTKAYLSATNWSLGLDFYKKSPLSSWDTEVINFANSNRWWKKLSLPSTVLTILKVLPCQICIYWFSNMDFQFRQPKFGALPVLQEYPSRTKHPRRQTNLKNRPALWHTFCLPEIEQFPPCFFQYIVHLKKTVITCSSCKYLLANLKLYNLIVTKKGFEKSIIHTS